MASDEDRERRSKRRKRNIIKKHMVESKGAFAIKVHDARKTEYKREKLRTNGIDLTTSESEEEYDNNDEGTI